MVPESVGIQVIKHYRIPVRICSAKTTIRQWESLRPEKYIVIFIDKQSIFVPNLDLLKPLFICVISVEASAHSDSRSKREINGRYNFILLARAENGNARAVKRTSKR